MQSHLDDDLLRDGPSSKFAWLSYARAQESPYWNIFFLAMAWALTLTTSTLLTSVGPLTAKNLGASQSISAFTVGCFLIGAAVSSVPSGAIFRKYGRTKGFSSGCLFQLIGSVLGGLAILSNQLWLIFFGCFSIGLGQGLGQFYRFSAVEVSPEYLKSRAVTYVLSGGILAAFLGPTCATYSATLLKQDYLASFGLIAIIAILNQIVVLFVNFPPPIVPKQVISAEVPNALVASAIREDSAASNSQNDLSKSATLRMTNVVDNRESLSAHKIRSPWEIVTQPMFIVSCTVATLAHTVMVMIMSNVTLAMNDSGYSFGKGSLTLEVHFLAMFSPGFFTGSLIERYGTFGVAFLGALVFAMSSFVLAIGEEFWNYSLGMVLSGLGWNFAFSAGTVMLTCCYKVRVVLLGLQCFVLSPMLWLCSMFPLRFIMGDDLCFLSLTPTAN
jgi:MFS family permease